MKAIQAAIVSKRDGEALGRVELPRQLVAGAEQFLIHPALLDACFQVAQFAASESQDRRTFLPARIDRIAFFAKPGTVVFCHAKLVHSNSHAFVWNFQICDEEGCVLLAAQGYRVQAVRGMSASSNEDADNWLYKTKWVNKPLSQAALTLEQPQPGTWLIFADRSGVAERLGSLLKERGASPLLLFQEQYSGLIGASTENISTSLQADLRHLFAKAIDKKIAGVVHLWSLDAPAAKELDPPSLLQAEAGGCHSVLHLVQAMAIENAAAPVWLVTRCAQCTGPADSISVAQSPLLGVGRTVLTEFPHLACRMVDLSSDNRQDAAAVLLQEIVFGDGETEVAWRGESRFANRLAPISLDSHSSRAALSRKRGYRLIIPASGVMDQLDLHEIRRRKPRASEVEIEICAAALNFRDVMKSLGIYPMESDRDLLLGDECSGRIVAVGNQVEEFAIGDEVIASGAGCFASHLTVPAEFVLRKPARLSFEQAATIPVAYMTAWYALHHLGRIRRGERILIHAATGGVGLAAIQIAQLAGAEVFATAGNDEKRSHLRRLGIRHIMDSRSTAFADEVRTFTKGAGVDLILNSLAGDAIAIGLSVLAPGGRFLEIGKRDVYANTAIGLRAMRSNVSMFVIDMGQVIASQPNVVQSLLQTILKLFRSGKLQPLPHLALPVSQAEDAFRFMAQAKHIGKIVLSMQDVKVAPRSAPPRRAIEFSAKASYLITGGLGGFGLAVAQWMVERGAKNLVLTGRSGAAAPEAKRAVAELKRRSANVLVVKADVTDERQVERVLAQIDRELAPLRGIFHAAMVLDDGFLPQLTPERFARVMAPKVAGAWNLHVASSKLLLDHFVLFSSVSALVGTAGQANYAAANCFLDALAHHRNALGLPALSVNWGALSEVGVLARNPEVAHHLAAHGVYGIGPAQATEMLGRLLQRNITQIGFMHVDWQRLFGNVPHASPAPRFSEVFVASSQQATGSDSDLRRTIRSAPDSEKPALACALVGESVARVLRTSAARLEPNRPLREAGLDSLMAFELLNRLEVQFGISLPTSKISASTTVASLAAVVLESLDAGVAKPADAKVEVQPIERNGNPTIELAPWTEQMLTLRACTLGTPIFFMHPAGGGTAIYDALAAQLPEGFPVLAIQSRMLAGAGDEWNSVEEMARNYAEIIGCKQPEGDLRLAGFSAGGFFALATARELERRGRRVSLVALIETPVAMLDPAFPRERVLKNLIAEVFDHLAGEPALPQQHEQEELSGSMMEVARSILKTKDEAAQLRLATSWLAKQGVDIGNGGDAGLKRFFAVFIRHANLIESIKAEAVDAPVWLGRGGLSWLTDLPVSPSIRKRIARGEFSEEILDGRHFELMHPPFVETLAARLGAALAKTEEACAEEAFAML